MPVPMTCFNCGKYIQDDYFKYIDLCKKYKDQDNAQYLAIRDLKIWKQCCRKMFISIQCTDDYIL